MFEVFLKEVLSCSARLSPIKDSPGSAETCMKQCILQARAGFCCEVQLPHDVVADLPRIRKPLAVTAITNLIMSNDTGRPDYWGGLDPTLTTKRQSRDCRITPYLLVYWKKKLHAEIKEPPSMNQSVNPQHIMANIEAAAASWAEPNCFMCFCWSIWTI